MIAVSFYCCLIKYKIEFSEGTYINKTSASKKCDIFYCWYFLDKGFTFEPYVCKRCHDVLMMCVNLNDIAILYINGAEYHCVIYRITKSNAVNLLQNVNTKPNLNI